MLTGHRVKVFIIIAAKYSNSIAQASLKEYLTINERYA
jgi:hypothetical protein